MIREMLRQITQYFPLTAAGVGEFQKQKISGMDFEIFSFQAQGLGHVSAMTARGFFGLMKMDTLIINPCHRDMPLFSYDRVQAMGNDTLIFELYDTLLEKADLSGLEAVRAEAAALPDHDLGSHWYDPIKLPQSLAKKGKKAHRAAFDETARAYLQAYLYAALAAPACLPDKKQAKASVYVEGLLQNGGPSTDVFKKGLGPEKTALLFRRVLFGTEL